MTQYKYATVLRAQNDGKPPNDNIEEGDEILKAGKHPTDKITYLGEEKGIEVIRFEQVEVYEADRRMSKDEIQEFGKEQHFDEADA